MSDSSDIFGARDGSPQEFAGSLSDGDSLAARPVAVRILPQGLHLRMADTGGRPGRGGKAEELWPWNALVSSGPLLPGEEPLLSHRDRPGTRLFISDPGVVPLLLRHAPGLGARRHDRKVIIALLAGALAILSILALPWFSGFSPARIVAGMLPQSWHERVGRSVLQGLAREGICSNPAGRRALRHMVERLAGNASRASGKVLVARLGIINAFTLPGGHVVLSDALIDNARSADEVGGVLAHELGHAEAMHPEASLVRAGGLSLLGMVLFGDGSIGSLAGMLLQLRFSRQAEREADAHAVRLLSSAHVNPARLADFLQRIAGDDGAENGLIELFSTHPLTRERVQRIRAAALDRSQPLLSQGEWQALRTICDRTMPVQQALQSR